MCFAFGTGREVVTQMQRWALLVVLDDYHEHDYGQTPRSQRVMSYRVDLDGDDPAGHLRKVLARYQPSGKDSRSWPEGIDDDDAATIREWARRHELPVSSRGRIPDGIRRQYEASKATPNDLTVADAVDEARRDEQKVISMEARRLHVARDDED